MKSLCEMAVAKSGVVMVVAESYVVVVAKNESECRRVSGLRRFGRKECAVVEFLLVRFCWQALVAFSWVTVRMVVQMMARSVQ